MRINTVSNWKLVTGTLVFGDTPIMGVSAEDLATAATCPEIKTRHKSGDITRLLGIAWDCAVAVRERTVFPASPHFSAVAKVSAAFKESLGEELFEKFLRPSAKVGLPPAK